MGSLGHGGGLSGIPGPDPPEAVVAQQVSSVPVPET